MAWYRRARWRRLRAVVLADRPLCEDCTEAGRITPATDVHHTIARKACPDRDLDYTNLRALCASCHAIRSGRGE
jgi:5-methylcytosine-specific restriction protein A